MASHTTKFLFDDGEYFAAHTDSGGIRVGMNAVIAIEFPAGHELYSEAATLDSAAAIEAFIDAQIEAGRIPLNSRVI
jgi:hypothetical protein